MTKVELFGHQTIVMGLVRLGISIAFGLATVGTFGCAGGGRPDQGFGPGITSVGQASDTVSEDGDGDDGDESGFPDEPGPDESPLDDRPVVQSAKHVAPIIGGTVLALADGKTVIAADPDRDMIHVIDLESATETASIKLGDGDMPGRVAQDSHGGVHVVLRGTGEVATIDHVFTTVLETRPACPNPRGIAHDPSTDELLVACAGGDLVTLAPDGTREAFAIAKDLRDVIVNDGRRLVSRFRTTELFQVDQNGFIISANRALDVEMQNVLFEASTAWRTIGTPDGGWLMLHQAGATGEITPTDGGEHGGWGSPPASAACNGVVATALTHTDVLGDRRSSGKLRSTVLAVDVATSDDGATAAVAIAGQSDPDSPMRPMVRGVSVMGVGSFDRSLTGECTDPDNIEIRGQPVAVDFVPGDGLQLVILSREPAVLIVNDLAAETSVEIPLSGESRFDTGHEMFHQDVGGGIACASCHPEGGDDGRVWNISGEQARRTQPLNTDLAGTAPFHWDGDMDDVGTLVLEIMTGAMGAARQSPERAGALEDYILAIDAPAALRVPTDAAVVRGEQTFADLGCASCHAGDNFTNNQGVPIHDAEGIQVPPLRGVALRPPYGFDGRNLDLYEAVWDMLDIAGTTSLAADDDVEDLVAFLESL